MARAAKRPTRQTQQDQDLEHAVLSTGEPATRYHLPERATAQIAKTLREVTTITGWRMSQIWDDWLAVIDAALTDMPAQAAAAARGESRMLADEPEATQQLYARLASRYHRDGDETIWPRVAAIFARALAELSDAVQRYGYHDYLGKLYMQLEIANPGSGQFFTPYHICLLMAQMIGGLDPLADIHARIKAALLHEDNLLGQALLLGGALFGDMPGVPADAECYFFEHLLPAALPFYEPLRFCDPCIGGGAMAIAHMSLYPDWVHDYGLVQYFGQDIDPTCVLMTRVQLNLFGANGFRTRIIAAHAQAGGVLHTPAATAEAVQAVAGSDDELAAVLAVPVAAPAGKLPRVRKTARGNVVVEHQQLGLGLD
jgi:hypothetical protein